MATETEHLVTEPVTTPSTRLYKIALLVTLAVLVVFGVVGAYVEARYPDPGGLAVAAAQLFGLLIFLTIAYTLVPIITRGFLAGQVKIGNGELPLVKILIAHERSVWKLLWVFMTLGWAIALPFALYDWLQHLGR